MEKAKIKEIIRSFVNGTVQITDDSITDDSLLFREGFFDSMGFILLISFLEERFKISAEDEDLVEENFESINSISEFVLRKIGMGNEID